MNFYEKKVEKIHSIITEIKNHKIYENNIACSKKQGTGQMDGWVDGWMDVGSGLKIAYSNQKINFLE